jgi:hypothetical protein
MITERHHPITDPEPTNALRPQAGTGHLDALRRRAEQHGQAARDAIARVAQCARPEQMLDQIKNQGGE